MLGSRAASQAWAVWILIATIAIGCGKKKDDDDDTAANPGVGGGGGGGGEGGGDTSIPETISNPAGVLSLALDSFASLDNAGIGATMSGNGASLDKGPEFTQTDCSEHAEAVARAGEDADNAGRLRLSHPRAALQSAYCQITKNTGSADSLLGTITQSRMLLCIIGSGQVFDGVERSVTRTYDDLVACLPPGVTEEEKAEMFGTDTSMTVTARVTASAPPAFGGAGWDGSLQMNIDDFGDSPIEIKLLLKDSGGLTAVSSLTGDGRALPVNAWLVGLNSTTGEAWMVAKHQRMRTPDGTGSNGWNRHTVVYIKGTMDANRVYHSVDAVSIAKSDLSQGNNVTSVDQPIQHGQWYMVTGADATGFKSNAYGLSCFGSGGMGSYTCEDPNLAASWKADNGVACNGSLDGTSCSGAELKLAADADTEFAMIPGSATFLTTEAWFAALVAPSFTSVVLRNAQQ